MSTRPSLDLLSGGGSGSRSVTGATVRLVATLEDELRTEIRRLDRQIAANDAKAEAARVARREARRRLRGMGVSWASLAALSACSTTAIHRDLQSDEARQAHYEQKNGSRRVAT